MTDSLKLRILASRLPFPRVGAAGGLEHRVEELMGQVCLSFMRMRMSVLPHQAADEQNDD